jgi:hypothetical protein
MYSSVWMSIITVQSTDYLVLISETQYVFCEVRNELLNII